MDPTGMWFIRLAMSQYIITVVAKDGGQPSLSSENTISVTVSDVNDNRPEFSLSPYTFYVTEGNSPGASVFSVKASDRDENDNARISYHIIRDGSEDNKVTSFLNINTDNGEILALKSFDFETLKTFQFQVVASDSGTPSLSNNVTVNVFILDQNDNAPVILYPLSSNGSTKGVEEIPRNVNAGHLVTKVRAYDICERRLDCVINLKTVLENPLEIHYVTVEVVDINDHSPIFPEKEKRLEIFESTIPGARFQLQPARDPDGSQFSVHQYKLSHSDHFRLELKDRDDGKMPFLVLQKQLDREAAREHTLLLTAIDGGRPASDEGTIPLSTDKSVIIKVIDLNDNPPEIEVTSFSKSVPEDCRIGTTVALISVNDLDSGPSGKVSCFIPEDVPFAISPSLQDNMYAIVTKSLLDREERYFYELTVVAKDAGVPSLLSEKTITVAISDVNDNRPQFSVSPYIFYITENNDLGAQLFSVKASDCDDSDNARISYHVYRDNSEGSMALFLNINSESGDVTALKSFDFETLKTFQFQIVASDSGTPSLSNNVTVNVFILDQNDNAPVILYPLSSNGSAQGVEEIPRNVNAGHLVTKVRAYDADIGYNGWLLFSLQEVTDHSLFALDRYTGQIRTLRSFTETDDAEHKLLILVKDNGNVSLSATATVIVKLVEPKEAFAASDVKSAAKDDEDDNNVIFYLMITLGAVSVLFLVSIIVLIAMQCSKSTDYTSKYLPETNYDGTLCNSIQYRSGEKRYMLVGPRMSIGSTIVPGSHANTLVLPDRRCTSEEVRKALF
uniref:Protocadherin 2 alpha a 15 n=1 Tax=Astatotilapia calliptera TaxID=8154 RepID=A0AAX7U7F4_ASTCA